jgi:hypothetical protein
MGFAFKSKGSKAVRGGSGKMVGKQHAGTQTPGQTATKSGAGGKWAKGGSGKMAGFTGSRPAKGC